MLHLYEQRSLQYHIALNMAFYQPRLAIPLEILDRIISQIWLSPLSTEDRIALMTSSVMVSHAWSNVFDHISSKDVYIPRPSYLPQFFRLTRRDTQTRERSPRELLCRSIHLSVENSSVHPPCPADHRQCTGATVALALLVSTLSSYHGGFPNLRILSFAFLNMNFYDVLTYYRFFRFPGQVTDLELSFSFDPATPPWLLKGLRSAQARRGCLYPFIPSVRRLAVVGASDAFITDMTRTCNNLDTLEMDLADKVAAVRWGEQPQLDETNTQGERGCVASHIGTPCHG